MTISDNTNPKDLVGIRKPPLWLVPGGGLLHTAMAFKNGAEKYGAYNWRHKKVKASIYCDAILRHLQSFIDGEDNASDSGIHHLGHAAASLFILLDAIETGNIIDDRPPPGPTPKLIERFTCDKNNTQNDQDQRTSPFPKEMELAGPVLDGGGTVTLVFDPKTMVSRYVTLTDQELSTMKPVVTT